MNDTTKLEELLSGIKAKAGDLSPNQVMEFNLKLRVGASGLEITEYTRVKKRVLNPKEMIGPSIVEKDWDIMFKALEGQIMAEGGVKLLELIKANGNKLPTHKFNGKEPSRAFLNKVFEMLNLPYRVLFNGRIYGAGPEPPEEERYHFVGRMF